MPFLGATTKPPLQTSKHCFCSPRPLSKKRAKLQTTGGARSKKAHGEIGCGSKIATRNWTAGFRLWQPICQGNRSILGLLYQPFEFPTRTWVALCVSVPFLGLLFDHSRVFIQKGKPLFRVPGHGQPGAARGSQTFAKAIAGVGVAPSAERAGADGTAPRDEDRGGWSVFSRSGAQGEGGRGEQTPEKGVVDGFPFGSYKNISKQVDIVIEN